MGPPASTPAGSDKRVTPWHWLPCWRCRNHSNNNSNGCVAQRGLKKRRPFKTCHVSKAGGLAPGFCIREGSQEEVSEQDTHMQFQEAGVENAGKPVCPVPAAW